MVVINRGDTKPKHLHMLCEVFQPNDIIAKGFQGSVSAVGTECKAEIQFRSVQLQKKKKKHDNKKCCEERLTPSFIQIMTAA